MDSETHHNPTPGGKRKRRASDTLPDDDHDVNHSQAHLQYASSTRNLQQPLSSASNFVNGGSDPSIICHQCVHCHCGYHVTRTTAGMKEAEYSLPVGFRFIPTDVELIKHYLLKKIKNEDLPKTNISEADIYGNHPKDIVGNFPQAIEDGWYFFTPRSRKYPKGDRLDRKAGSGYWKATGPDKVITENQKKIGGRKSLIYYEGHPPHWTKTKWMMHEYKIEGYDLRNRSNSKYKKFDGYVLCKIYENERMKEKVVTRAAPNDQVENEQALVPYQSANILLSDQEDDPDQSLNPATPHVDNKMSIVQHINQSVEKGVREVTERQAMTRDQPARVISNYQVKNNNVVVQNYQHTGSLYDVKTPYSRFLTLAQVKSFQEIRNPPADYTSPSFQQQPTLPPCNEHGPHKQPPSGMCWSGPHSNPPRPQVALCIQEDSGCEPDNDVRQNIERMYARDEGYGLLDVEYFQF